MDHVVTLDTGVSIGKVVVLGLIVDNDEVFKKREFTFYFADSEEEARIYCDLHGYKVLTNEEYSAYVMKVSQDDYRASQKNGLHRLRPLGDWVVSR